MMGKCRGSKWDSAIFLDTKEHYDLSVVEE